MKAKRISKVFVIIFLMLAVIAPIIASCIQNANNYDFKMVKYRLDAVIDEKGDMHVVESVTNKYNNLNSVFFKELIYEKNNDFSDYYDNSNLVKDVRLVVEDFRGVVFDTSVNENTSSHFVGYSYNGDYDERGMKIRCSGTIKNCEQILYYDARGISEETTFTYYYTIEGVVTQYNDISEFNWVMLDYQPMNISDVEISITLPDGDYDIRNMNTYFHGTSYGKREFVDNNKILVTVDELIKDERVETRLLLDTSVFSSVREKNKYLIDREAAIMAFEENQQKEGQKETLLYYWGSVVLFGLGLVVSIFLSIRCYKKYDKEWKSEFYNEYYRELPGEYPPAVAGYLYKYKEVSNEDLTATLLDLIRRKYLILKNLSSSVNDEGNYEIWLNKDKKQDDLLAFEKHLIKWFIDDIGNKEKVTSKDLDSYCDNYNNATRYQDSNRKWVALVKQEGEKYNFFDKETDRAKGRYSLFSLIIFAFNFILLSLYNKMGYKISLMLFWSLLFVVFAYISYVLGVNRRSKKGNEDYVRWQAFKKFLEEFSNFEDYPVPSLVIWEHYLVYATSFGIADKVMKQLRLKFDVSNVTDTDYTFVIYYGLRHNNLVRLNKNINNARMSAIQTISRYNSSRSNGSFGSGRSGGGFSGGSSFGGGGGSFGGR